MPVFRSRVLVGRWWQVAPRVAGIALMAGALGWGLKGYGLYLVLGQVWTWRVLSLSFWLDNGDVVNTVIALTAIAIAVVFLTVAVTERLEVDEQGVRIRFGPRGTTLFRIPWDRLASYEVITHDASIPDIVVHYRPWFFGRFGVGIHPGRYEHPAAAADAVIGQLATRGIPGKHWFVPRSAAWWGRLALLVGVIPMVVSALLGRAALAQWIAIDTPAAGFSDLPNTGMFEVLFLVSAVCCSFGFGALSAYRRGAVRMVLLVIWLAFVAGGSRMLMYGLTMIAVYAILMARLTPMTIGGEEAHIPPPGVWGFYLTGSMPYLAPVLAFAAFMLAFYHFRRPGPAWDYAPAPEVTAAPAPAG